MEQNFRVVEGISWSTARGAWLTERTMPRPKGKHDRSPRKRKPWSKAEEKSRQDTTAKKRAATQGKSRITRYRHRFNHTVSERTKPGFPHVGRYNTFVHFVDAPCCSCTRWLVAVPVVNAHLRHSDNPFDVCVDGSLMSSRPLLKKITTFYFSRVVQCC